jgi:hypothetical protein
MQMILSNAYSKALVSLRSTAGNSIFGFLKKTAPSFPMKIDTSDLILQIMQSNPCFFENYIDSVKSFEIQAIYTQIDRDSNDNPSFSQFSYRLNDKEYFCPASTSKLPVLLIALEKLNKLNSFGIDRYTAMNFDSVRPCQKAALKDTVAEDSILNIAHYIQKILLVSDNDSYNRLFEFVGQKAINKRLWKMGFRKSCIIQQFNGCGPNENRYSNPLSFIDKNGKKLYSQPMMKNRRKYKNPLGKVVKGIGYFDDNGKLVREPRNFTYYNNIPLRDLNDFMLRTVFPESFSKEQQFQIKKDDYGFLYKYMSMMPRESEFHKYHDTIRYPDNRKKYLMYGTDTCRHIKDSTIRIFNIVGQLSGYLTDCAYIVDFKNNVEFVLAVTIYNNQSGIFDVSNYRYKTLGFPFLQEFGRSVYNYEITRPKKYKPDLNYLKKYIDNPVK